MQSIAGIKIYNHWSITIIFNFLKRWFC